MDTEVQNLFKMALGLESPWYIKDIEFSKTNQQLEIWIDFNRGSTFLCPECGRPGCKPHDTEHRQWRHLDFFQHKTILHARQPRVKCQKHGVKTLVVPWARSGSGFTEMMESYIITLVQNGMTARQVGYLIGEHDTRVWRILEHYVDEARSRSDFSNVTAICLDETSRKRGHNYVTVFADAYERKVLFAIEGKGAETISAFRQEFELRGGKPENVTEACLDMSEAFKSGLKSEFPVAQQTFDNFHIIQLLNKGVDEVRRQEQKSCPDLKGTRYIWLKNEWNRTEKQSQRFNELCKKNLETAEATHLKAVFQDIFSLNNATTAETLLDEWCEWVSDSNFEPMKKASRTIQSHKEGILAWFSSKLNNGFMEGINSLIQAAKARSRGFKTPRYLKTMIYLIAGKLDLSIHPLR